MKLWCPTTKILLVLPCSQEEYNKLLKYAVVVSEYKLSRSSTIVMFTGGAQVVEVCIANGDA